MMQHADSIRDAISQVQSLRAEAESRPGLSQAIAKVKRLQSDRFAATYQDMTNDGEYKAAALFFLHELYGDKDYSDRDVQFHRIAGAIERLMPKAAVVTAVALAQLHAMTERLDHAMGLAWLGMAEGKDDLSDAARYVHAWREVGARKERLEQLQMVQQIGYDLDDLTRIRGLRSLLKMMRGPAHAAGLSSLQHFLETGFDTFAQLRKTQSGARGFLQSVMSRETAVITMLFDADLDVCLQNLPRN